MNHPILKKKSFTQVKWLFPLLLFWTILIAKVDLTYAVTETSIASGLSAAVGVALDETQNHLYFVEYNAPNIKRILLNPACEGSIATPCTIQTIPIVPGFSHAEDIQLDIEHGFAYVTTRDNPGTGGLWKVNIATGAKTLITFNLGAPQQLVLDLAHNRAYTVGFNDGRLRSVDLTTGVKVPIYKSLEHPVGLAVTKDGKYAYVSEQTALGGRISKIDMVTGTKVTDVVTGLTAPFFLAWADVSENSLYVPERIPANKLTRVDLVSATKNDVITGLPMSPSGIVVKSSGAPAYVTSDSQISRIDLIGLLGPIFMGVGHVPASDIDSITGYATTAPGYFYQVKDSPFGGTLNFFGNLTNFSTPPIGATHYAIMVSKDGGAFEAVSQSWQMYKWNTVTFKYDLVTVAPDVVTTPPLKLTARHLYRIPLDGGNYHPEFWYPSFLFMRWPSGENGLYTFTVELYQESGMTYTERTGGLIGTNSLTLNVDNTPQTAELVSILQNVPPEADVPPCKIVTSGNNEYKFKITAYDPNQHMLSYSLTALWGDNKSKSVASVSYSAVPASGVINAKVPAGWWAADCNCAHTFYLDTWKRTIDGYNYILYRGYHKSITIANTPVPVCP